MSKPDSSVNDVSLSGVFRNSWAILGSQVAGALTGPTTRALFLATLGRALYGEVALALAWVDIAKSFASFGIDVAALRFAGAEGATGRVMATLLRVRLALSLFGFLGVVGYALTLGTVPAEVPILAAVVLFPSALNHASQVFFQATHRNKEIIWVAGLSSFIHLAGLGGLWLAGASLPFLLIGSAVSETVSGLILTRIVRAETGEFRFSGKLAKKLCISALPIGYLGIVVMMYKRAGYAVVDYWHGTTVVADLDIALQVAVPINVVGATISISTLAPAARLGAEGRWEELRTMVGSMARRIALVLAPFVLLAAVLVGPVVNAIAPSYSGLAGALRWEILSTFPTVFCQLFSAVLIAVGLGTRIAGIATFNLFVFAAGAWLAVPSMGAAGATLATLIMESLNVCMQAALLYYTMSRRLRVA